MPSNRCTNIHFLQALTDHPADDNQQNFRPRSSLTRSPQKNHNSAKRDEKLSSTPCRNSASSHPEKLHLSNKALLYQKCRLVIFRQTRTAQRTALSKYIDTERTSGRTVTRGNRDDPRQSRFFYYLCIASCCLPANTLDLFGA